MANISLTPYTNGFFVQFSSHLPRWDNSITNFSRLGTFKGTVSQDFLRDSQDLADGGQECGDTGLELWQLSFTDREAILNH